MSNEKATFAAGCFWGVQHIFQEIEGVTSTKSGYIGGKDENPTYEQICTGKTGHAEAVEVIYDPEKVSFEKLLDIFWRCHNPTTINQQGVDIGTQYRSAIFYHNEEQRELAQKSMKEFDEQKTFPNPAVTEIIEAPIFYDAEDYHQHYFEKNPNRQVCHILRD